MKKLLKILFLFLFIAFLFSLFSEDDSCYFKNGDAYDKLLIGNVVSESVLKYAKFEGASTDGFVKELTEVNDSTATVIVSASLKAKNAFGVYKNSFYDVEATLNCSGYTVLSISDKLPTTKP